MKMREIIYSSRSKDSRQTETRVSMENIQQVQVLKMVTVIGQFTADGRVGLETNAHLPISADDQLVFGTPAD